MIGCCQVGGPRLLLWERIEEPSCVNVEFLLPITARQKLSPEYMLICIWWTFIDHLRLSAGVNCLHCIIVNSCASAHKCYIQQVSSEKMTTDCVPRALPNATCKPDIIYWSRHLCRVCLRCVHMNKTAEKVIILEQAWSKGPPEFKYIVSIQRGGNLWTCPIMTSGERQYTSNIDCDVRGMDTSWYTDGEDQKWSTNHYIF